MLQIYKGKVNMNFQYISDKNHAVFFSPSRTVKDNNLLNQRRPQDSFRSPQRPPGLIESRDPTQAGNAMGYNSPNFTTLRERKLVDRLKDSGDTRISATDSTGRKEGGDSDIKVNQIGNLLSEFKSKYASLQQKYSLKLKSSYDQHPVPQYQPMTPKPEITRRIFESPTKAGNINNPQTQNERSSHLSSNSGRDITLLGSHLSLTKDPDTSAAIRQKPKQQETQTPQTQQAKKAQFRATFGPTRNRPIYIPERTIKQAEEVPVRRYKFSNFKAVQSEDQCDQDRQTMADSVVIEKYSSTWKKLEKTLSNFNLVAPKETLHSGPA